MQFKNLPKYEKQRRLSIEKIIMKHGKTFHNNIEIYIKGRLIS